jgi:hypothetical protein
MHIALVPGFVTMTVKGDAVDADPNATMIRPCEAGLPTNLVGLHHKARAGSSAITVLHGVLSHHIFASRSHSRRCTVRARATRSAAASPSSRARIPSPSSSTMDRWAGTALPPSSQPRVPSPGVPRPAPSAQPAWAEVFNPQPTTRARYVTRLNPCCVAASCGGCRYRYTEAQRAMGVCRAALEAHSIA